MVLDVAVALFAEYGKCQLESVHKLSPNLQSKFSFGKILATPTIREKNLKQDPISAKDLTIDLPERCKSPYHRLD